MPSWTEVELDKIGNEEELEIASLRLDGSLRNPVTIWVVRVGDDLYVRAYKGINGPWYRHTQVRHAGRIRAGGVEKEVTFSEVSEADILDRVDTTYRSKYRRYDAETLDPMLTPMARAATIKLSPR